jgi:hypothetical protein
MGLRVLAKIPVETSDVELSGFSGLTVVCARRNSIIALWLIAMPITKRMTLADRRTVDNGGQIGGSNAMTHIAAATVIHTSVGGKRSSK